MTISGDHVEGLCASWLNVQASDGQAPYYLTGGSFLGVVCHYIVGAQDYTVRAVSGGDWLANHLCNWLHQWEVDPANGQAPMDWTS